MKKIYISLGLLVVFFVISVSVVRFREYQGADEQVTVPEKEKYSRNVHAVKIDRRSDKESESKNISALELQVEDLKRQVKSLSEKMLESDQKMLEVDYEKESDSIETGLDTKETLADEAVHSQYEEQTAILSARLMQEPVDKEWAEETISAIESVIETNEELAGIELIQTTCMSTLCKLEINIDQNRPAGEVMQKLSMHRTWKGATTFAVNSAGYAEIIFAREGHSLSEAEVQ